MADVRNNSTDQRYEIVADGQLAGFVDYRLDSEAITFIHAETLPGHEGKGVARQLVEFALADARAQQLSVLPRCPYVRKVVADKTSEYLDLVPRDARAAFGLPLD
ncbi:MAG: GNAT family N-acetyltransferase [Actinomycetota bacterium]|nr:GNAT family N-acetyltransferase [Actinomycetota bacterium]